MDSGQTWRQFAIASIANLLLVAIGYTMGWTAPINGKLQSDEESPLDRPVTVDEEAWIGSLLTIGAIFGPFIVGYLASRIGRKWTMLASSLPLFIGWVLLAAAKDVALLYAGRVFCGVTMGMGFTIVPLYCAEIASDEYRGALGALLQVLLTIGYLLVYGIGPFVSYSVVIYVGTACTVAFAIVIYFMPESPFYYLGKGDKDSAASCLATIRGKTEAGVMTELDAMASDVTASMEKTARMTDLFRGNNFKAFYISMALIFFQQLSGINAVLFYLTDIFEAAGSALDASISTIIIGAVQLGASCVIPLAADRLGRKILLMISSAGTAVGLFLLGAYFVLADNGNPVAEQIGWLPVVALMVFIITFCWGLGSLPWAVMAELFPIEVKVIAMPVVNIFCWILAFLITRYFSALAAATGMGVTFFIFGACCLASFFFTLFLIPETKGKSFQEIQDLLSGNSPKKTPTWK
ncbi:facilitated trehalose transporter Tret1-2 homolog [Trichoplusia ni]|uniref:Facilitated trehalose transporter Tret1-2 homolog n=1 Tax=Trichoplusia ni TaxID=7111 RepID=A0A7E5VNT7_TRINI|nr:facilitated trehalose transporter Tret1-2 homolog [Trichoplusia ni]